MGVKDARLGRYIYHKKKAHVHFLSFIWLKWAYLRNSDKSRFAEAAASGDLTILRVPRSMAEDRIIQAIACFAENHSDRPERYRTLLAVQMPV